MPKRWLIGLSSGSSLTGVDAALASCDGLGSEIRLKLAHFLHLPYPRDFFPFMVRLHGAGAQTLHQIALLHRLLGETFAEAVRRLADQAKINLAQIMTVGLAEQTLWHETEGRYPTTLGLGMAEVVAEKTGLTTLSGFPTRDVVAGGQGFPLTPMVDSRLFQDSREDRVLIHLGGYATLVWLPAAGGPRQDAGFQAGPCGLLLDGLMRQVTGGKEILDAGGKHAVQGCAIESLLSKWLSHPLLQRRPPKSWPSGELGPEFIDQALQGARQLQRSLHDLLCTATHWVARMIVQGCQRFLPWPPHRILVSGGGVKNGFLWRLLEQGFAGIPLEKTDAHGVPAEARKALAIAGLAALTLDGTPINLPGVTGASGPRLVGRFTPGNSLNWARCLGWMANQTQPLAVAA